MRQAAVLLLHDDWGSAAIQWIVVLGLLGATGFLTHPGLGGNLRRAALAAGQELGLGGP